MVVSVAAVAVGAGERRPMNEYSHHHHQHFLEVGEKNGNLHFHRDTVVAAALVHSRLPFVLALPAVAPLQLLPLPLPLLTSLLQPLISQWY